MTYRLFFHKAALHEWEKLAPEIKIQFKKKLAERLIHPEVLSAKLNKLPNCYKIKLRSVGYRLVYQVVAHQVKVLVLAVGKREGGAVYALAHKRTSA